MLVSFSKLSVTHFICRYLKNATNGGVWQDLAWHHYGITVIDLVQKIWGILLSTSSKIIIWSIKIWSLRCPKVLFNICNQKPNFGTYSEWKKAQGTLRLLIMKRWDNKNMSAGNTLLCLADSKKILFYLWRTHQASLSLRTFLIEPGII